ncbi:LuxR family transcriptional regulator, partial [Streptomyces sp. SID10815]|nr:LuxR family transcriptional regulator [Streptomyces sp. SID10815]
SSDLADALAALPYPAPLPGRPLPPVTGVLGLLVPELADRLPPPPAGAADPEVRRCLAPRAVEALLSAYGDAVLVVEDVHRADPATLGLIRRLIGAMPARLRLVVVEDPSPGLPALGFRAPARLRSEEIDVRPWTAAQTAESVRNWLADLRPDHLTEQEDIAALVHELTRGLPEVVGHLLWAAGELLRSRETASLAAEADGAWSEEGEEARADSPLAALRQVGAPAAVRREWARRCAPLTEDARRVVEAA